MQLSNLPKTVKRAKKRVGRGLGSGKGKTAGRGQKGQKARGSVPADFSGSGGMLYKRLPLLRGWGNRKVSVKPFGVNLAKLAVFKDGEKVDLESLIKKGVVLEKDVKSRGVKILGGGIIEQKLTVSRLLVSKGARQRIEQAGGKIE